MVKLQRRGRTTTIRRVEREIVEGRGVGGMRENEKKVGVKRREERREESTEQGRAREEKLQRKKERIYLERTLPRFTTEIQNNNKQVVKR